MNSKLDNLIATTTRDEIIDYFNNHTTEDSAQHFGVCRKTFVKLLDLLGIEKHSLNTDIKFGCQQKYGVDNPFQLDSVKEKSAKTKLDAYGSSTYNNREKAIKTSNQIYGVGNYNNREKSFETYKNNSGYDNPFQDLEHINDCIANKYGSLNSFYGVREQILVQALEDKYGVSNVSQIPDVAQKKVLTAKRAVASDGTVFDSNWEVKVYEYCIDRLIPIKRNIPIKFNYQGKQRTTFIDFSIDGVLTEVKGNHLLDGCFDYNMPIPIEVKLSIYRDNHVTIVTDVDHLKNRNKFSGIELKDIQEFN